MDSRSNRYYEDINNEVVSSTRSSRNKRLYREVYGKYDDLENLPLDDNTDEIDMSRLKELVSNKKEHSKPAVRENFNVLEQRKRNIDEQKVYDINKILEKAKYENNKLKGNIMPTSKVNKQILHTLQSTELSLEEINQASRSGEKDEGDNRIQDNTSLIEDEEKLEMTRELKYRNLDEEEAKKESENSLSLDLFTDLKPTGNTIVTKPIRDDDTRSTKPNLHSDDTSDIDIIKNGEKMEEPSNDFFTSSYEFSKKDFMPIDDDFSDLNKRGGILKILLLFLMVFVVGGVITYFILNYGIGIS